MAGKIKVTQIKRPSTEKQKIVLLGLGLKKIDATRVLNDTEAIRGMVGRVQHLLCVEDVK